VERDGVRVRPAAVAGRFYPGDDDALAALVDAMLADVPPPRRRVRPVAVVAPHAGFRFSGPVAAAAYAHLAPWRGEVASVVVLGPAHFTPLHGMAIPSVGAFATPLGPVPVDADARAVAAGLSTVVVDDQPHAGEHAIETQLPFLIRTLGPGVPAHRRGRHAAVGGRHCPVRPARRSRHDRRRLHRSQPLPEPCAGPRTRHPHRRRRPRARHGDALQPGDACGFHPLRGLLRHATDRDLVVEQLQLATSADTEGDPRRVVGY